MTRRLAAVVAAALLLGLVPALPADAAERAPTLSVAPRNGGVLGSGPLDVDVTITNPGTAVLPAGELAFSVDKAPVAAASTLLAQIEKPSTVLLGYSISTTKRTPAVDPASSTTVRARLDGDDLRSILSAASGARLLYVRFRAGRVGQEVQTVAESAVVKMAKGLKGRIGFGTVIPLVAPANTTGVVDVEQQDALAAPGGAWSSVLEAARTMPSATIAMDPQVPASIRLAGDTAPASATGFLASLAAVPNPVVQLPYGDADLTLEHAAGLRGPPPPTSFDGSSTAAPAVDAATPTPDPAPVAADVPSTAELTRWTWAGQRLAWPVPGTSSAGSVRAQGPSVVLLGSDDVRDSAARLAAGPHATVRLAAGPHAKAGTAEALIVDRQASALLRRAAAGGSGGAAAAAPLVALLATDLVSGAAPAVLTSVGRGADLRSLPQVLGLLGGLPWVDGRSTLALAAADDSPSVAPRTRAVPAARVATARALLDAEHVVRDLGRSMRDPGVVTGPPRLVLLSLLSAGWRGQDPSWAAAAAAAQSGFRTVSGAVRIAKGDIATPIGSDGSLQVLVENGLPRAVTVDVRAAVSNGRLRFTNDRSERITVPANTSKRAKLGFRSITNGPTTVTLTLTTPAGTALGPPSAREVMVRAGFDTVVAVILLTLLGLLLALGVYRNVRRRSRPRVAAA